MQRVLFPNSKTGRITRFVSMCITCIAIFTFSQPILAQQNQTQSAQNESQANYQDVSAKIARILSIQAEKWNKRDLEGFMQTYWKSEKLTFSSGGKTTNGWQATLDRYKKRYQSDGAEMGTLTFDKTKIIELGKDSALVLGNWNLEMKSSNPKGNFSLVMKRIKGEWKIIHDHSSSLDEE